MRWLLRIVLAIVVIVAVAAAASYLLPRHVEIARTTTINATPEIIYPLVSDLRATQEWSPWLAADPETKLTYEGPESGAGQILKWDSAELGSGTQTITAVTENQQVTTALDFGDMGSAVADILLDPAGDRTAVTWTLDADMGNSPVGRYMGLFMDDMVGADYEAGLARLKALAEQRQSEAARAAEAAAAPASDTSGDAAGDTAAPASDTPGDAAGDTAAPASATPGDATGDTATPAPDTAGDNAASGSNTSGDATSAGAANETGSARRRRSEIPCASGVRAGNDRCASAN